MLGRVVGTDVDRYTGVFRAGFFRVGFIRYALVRHISDTFVCVVPD